MRLGSEAGLAWERGSERGWSSGLLQSSGRCGTMMADLDALLNVPAEEGACVQGSPSRMTTPSKYSFQTTRWQEVPEYSFTCTDGSSRGERVDKCDKIATALWSENSGPQAVLIRTDDRKRQRTVLTRECVNRCVQGGLFQQDEYVAPGYGWHDHGVAIDSKHCKRARISLVPPSPMGL